MADEILAACIGAGAALAGAIVPSIIGWIKDRYTRPILNLTFESKDDAYLVESTYMAGEMERTSKFVRVRLTNKGRDVARECRVFLTEVREVDGQQLHPTSFYDSKSLPWAGFPKNYSARPIPAGINAYIDVLRVSKGDPKWDFRVKTMFASQRPIETYKGILRLKITATADNAEPVSITLDVTFRGDYDGLRSALVA
jgi:hypothetical protein